MDIDLTTHWAGYAAVAIFIVAYIGVISEEIIHLRKSIPVLLAAGAMWTLIAAQHVAVDRAHETEAAVEHFLGEYAALLLFLMVAMTYVNSMSERNVFEALKCRLISRRCSYRKIFWITGLGSFFLSPLIDNLTTALVMCAVVLAVGRDNLRFVGPACVNIVVAANAGGAFSPFGDITTLMVWQKGMVEFRSFFSLLIPAAVNYLVPATIMSLAVPGEATLGEAKNITMKRGGLMIVALFVATIATAVSFHNFLDLPPFLGMMMGLGYLKAFAYYLYLSNRSALHSPLGIDGLANTDRFDSFREIARIEWDTLLFFFGVIMCVGGLGFIGYLAHLSAFFYTELDPTTANILVGLVSSVIDNIPVMVAVLEMKPVMDLTQWLLVTLTAGVGGSLLSIGSAAGVALMGQARGCYTFMTHLRWTPAIALGYGLSIWVHMLINGS